MEILLLIAIIVSAASGLYVAVAFNTRATQKFTPLVNAAAKSTDKKIEAVSGELQKHMKAITSELRENRKLTARLEEDSEELRKQVQAIADELRRNRDLITHVDAASGEIKQEIAAISGELRLERELATRRVTANGELQQQVQAIAKQTGHLNEQIGAQQAQFGKDLARLDHRVAEVGESLTQQSTRIAEIYRYVIRRETRAGNSAESDLLLLAMLEAESYVGGKGWGERPHLYALTAPTSAVAAEQEPVDGINGARPDALVPVEHERLPDGDLAEVLAGIQWPADVVGCVLVTELAALPPGNEGDGPIDPLASGEWASTQPDGRPARLIVGVHKSGGHMCGLRIKGEDEMQVRNEMAGDLVAVLQGTF